MVGVYIHYPYCSSICPYCAFCVTRYHTSKSNTQWLSSICREIVWWKNNIGMQNITIDSIYFGGGTPSMMPRGYVLQVLFTLSYYFYIDSSCEITLESNPCNYKNFSYFFSEGINRLSLGVQSLDDDVLSFLGRNHNGDLALKSLDTALHKFSNVSVDIIYSIRQDYCDKNISSVIQILSFPIHHISLYQLSFDTGSIFYKRYKRGEMKPIEDKKAYEAFHTMVRICRKYNFAQYEVSSFSRGNKWVSRHNMNYWSGGYFFGIGPKAFSRVILEDSNLYSTENYGISLYYKSISLYKSCINNKYYISHKNYDIEKFICAMRLTDGIDISSLYYIGEVIKSNENFRKYIDSGDIIYMDGNIKMSSDGMVRMDSILYDILEDILDS